MALRDGGARKAPSEWSIPFARSLTKQAARKALFHVGCGKIGRSPRCAPWHRRPSYDLRRAPCDHPDFTSNALHENLFRGSLEVTQQLLRNEGEEEMLLKPWLRGFVVGMGALLAASAHANFPSVPKETYKAL